MGIKWMLQQRKLESIPAKEMGDIEDQIMKLSAELSFRRGEDAAEDAGISREELHDEKDDWYSALSGGQRVKVELIRKVFLQKTCPGLLLIDEAFAPLDPLSKNVAQRMMKQHCPESLILVIYHADANEGGSVDAFFDETLHFNNGTASLLP